jgi:hypothetical protein
MNKEILDLADRKYQLRAREIEKKYQRLKSEIQFRTLTDYRAQIEAEKLLPQKLEEKSSALIDCYLQTFETAGSFPEHEDLVVVDRKLERLFSGGHGDETGSLSISTVCENQELERLACEQLRVRAAEMKIKRQAASNYTLNVHGDFIGPAQLGPNNTQNVASGIQYKSSKPQVRWSQLRPVVGDQRISGIGDVEVTAENIAEAHQIGGDPWVELHDVTTFGTSVRKFILGLFTPA